MNYVQSYISNISFTDSLEEVYNYAHFFDMENYEQMMKLSKVYKELEESESQVEAGQTMNARKQLASMREKYGA